MTQEEIDRLGALANAHRRQRLYGERSATLGEVWAILERHGIGRPEKPLDPISRQVATALLRLEEHVRVAREEERLRCAKILQRALAFEWSAEIAPEDDAVPHRYAAGVLKRVLGEVEGGGE